MSETKEHVASAIAKAQEELERALLELEKIPAFEPSSVAFTAHSLSNYLTITEGTVELILLHLGDHPDPEIKRWLEGVQHTTNLMSHTVSQLMNHSQPNEIQLHYEKVDLTLLVQRVSYYYQRVANRKSINLVSRSSGIIPPVWTDRVSVCVVLDNLISNAIKYSPPGTQISINLQTEDTWVRCDVRDQGPGLSKEDQAKLFQKGIKLTPTPSAGEPSTGYGLAVAKEFTDKVGAEIWCESVLGQGCCFTVRLPIYVERKPKRS